MQRFVKAERVEGPGALGSTQRLHHRYVIEVGNWTGRAQRVRVVENLPVSRESEVQVHLDEESTRPESWQKHDGHLAWVLDLPPRSKRSLTFAYTVTLPASYRVTGY